MRGKVANALAEVKAIVADDGVLDEVRLMTW